MDRLALEQLAKLGITDMDPHQLVGSLSVGRQQMVEIAKALLVDARVLVMDEPSSSLVVCFLLYSYLHAQWPPYLCRRL